MTNLRTRDIIALGFMTFALFIGAGNIIFPPIVAQQAGEHVWLAAFGFLVIYFMLGMTFIYMKINVTKQMAKFRLIYIVDY